MLCSVTRKPPVPSHSLKFHPCRGQHMQRWPNSLCVSQLKCYTGSSLPALQGDKLTYPCVLTPCYSPVCLQVSCLWNIICFKIALAGSHSNRTPDPVSAIGPRGVQFATLPLIAGLCATHFGSHGFMFIRIVTHRILVVCIMPSTTFWTCSHSK